MSELSPHLQALDRQLEEIRAESAIMLLSDLDGFLAGVILSPADIPVERWWPVIWREDGEDGAAPNQTVLAKAEACRAAIMQHHADIKAGLGRELYEPIYDIAEDGVVVWQPWIDGFYQGMLLDADGWDAISIEQSDAGDAMAALTVLLDAAFVEDWSPQDEEQKALVADAADVIPELIDLFAERHQRMIGALAPRIAPARSNKVGRNDPCPCGSGKKYKKCCGAAA